MRKSSQEKRKTVSLVKAADKRLEVASKNICSLLPDLSPHKVRAVIHLVETGRKLNIKLLPTLEALEVLYIKYKLDIDSLSDDEQTLTAVCNCHWADCSTCPGANLCEAWQRANRTA